jgi:hypothetical protein
MMRRMTHPFDILELQKAARIQLLHENWLHALEGIKPVVEK